METNNNVKLAHGNTSLGFDTLRRATQQELYGTASQQNHGPSGYQQGIRQAPFTRHYHEDENTVYVSGLTPDCAYDAFMEAMKQFGHVVTITRRDHPKNGDVPNMQYAFVRYYTKEGCQAALKASELAFFGRLLTIRPRDKSHHGNRGRRSPDAQQTGFTDQAGQQILNLVKGGSPRLVQNQFAGKSGNTRQNRGYNVPAPVLMSKALVVSNIPHDMVQQEFLDLLRSICPFKAASVNEGIDQLGRKTASVFVHSFFEAQKAVEILNTQIIRGFKLEAAYQKTVSAQTRQTVPPYGQQPGGMHMAQTHGYPVPHQLQQFHQGQMYIPRAYGPPPGLPLPSDYPVHMVRNALPPNAVHGNMMQAGMPCQNSIPQGLPSAYTIPNVGHIFPVGHDDTGNTLYREQQALHLQAVSQKIAQQGPLNGPYMGFGGPSSFNQEIPQQVNHGQHHVAPPQHFTNQHPIAAKTSSDAARVKELLALKQVERLNRVKSGDVPDPLQPEDMNNLFMKNLCPEKIGSTEAFLEVASEYGYVTSILLASNECGTSRGYGFVRFSSLDEAKACRMALHGKTLPGTNKPLLVFIAETADVRANRIAAYIQGHPEPPIEPKEAATLESLEFLGVISGKGGVMMEKHRSDAGVVIALAKGDSTSLEDTAEEAVPSNDTTVGKGVRTFEVNTKSKILNGVDTKVEDNPKLSVKVDKDISSQEDPLKEAFGTPTPPLIHVSPSSTNASDNEGFAELFGRLRTPSMPKIDEVSEEEEITKILGESSKKGCVLVEADKNVTIAGLTEPTVVGKEEAKILDAKAVPKNKRKGRNSRNPSSKIVRTNQKINPQSDLTETPTARNKPINKVGDQPTKLVKSAIAGKNVKVQVALPLPRIKFDITKATQPSKASASQKAVDNEDSKSTKTTSAQKAHKNGSQFTKPTTSVVSGKVDDTSDSLVSFTTKNKKKKNSRNRHTQAAIGNTSVPIIA